MQHAYLRIDYTKNKNELYIAHCALKMVLIWPQNAPKLGQFSENIIRGYIPEPAWVERSRRRKMRGINEWKLKDYIHRIITAERNQKIYIQQQYH